MNHPVTLTIQEVSFALLQQKAAKAMPPPVPARELGHSIGPSPATVNLAAFLDYVVRVPVLGSALVHMCSSDNRLIQHAHRSKLVGLTGVPCCSVHIPASSTKR